MTMPQMPDPFGATPQTRDVLLDVANERRRQIEKGWTPDHDDQHPTAFMAGLAFGRSVHGYSRARLVQSIAILVAAVESMDRRAAEEGQTP